MTKNILWIAMFSHTGSEIVKISKKIGRFPDRVITNKQPGSPDINKELLSSEIVYCSNRPSEQDYSRFLKTDAIVTLHGWMRIVPERICEEYNMFNLHPGLITKYPELKGKDPQKKVFDNYTRTYNDVGCVLHQVIPEVDAGSVIMETSTRNSYNGEQDLTKKLHSIATDMWVDFFQHGLYNTV